jgi:hypothetical protein
MLERISDFVSHPELILEYFLNLIPRTSKKTTDVERFLDVIRYFLSIWHVRPKGVKKPYNPVVCSIDSNFKSWARCFDVNGSLKTEQRDTISASKYLITRLFLHTCLLRQRITL